MFIRKKRGLYDQMTLDQVNDGAKYIDLHILIHVFMFLLLIFINFFKRPTIIRIGTEDTSSHELKYKIVSIPEYSFKLKNPYIKVTYNFPVSKVIDLSKSVELENVPKFLVYGDLGNDAKLPSEYDIRNFARNLTIELVLLENVFITNEGIVIKDNVYYYGNPECHYSVNLHRRVPNELTVEYFSDTLMITHEYGWFYAHWVIDFLPILFQVPKEILRTCTILLTNINEYIVDTLLFLGVDHEQFWVINSDKVVFSQYHYTARPILCCQFNAFLIKDMRRQIVEALKLDKSPPTLYLLYNREDAQFRKMENFDEVLKELKSKYPNIKWILEAFPTKFFEAVAYFNQIKLFIAIHGASFSNTIFMQPKTAVAEISVERWVDNYLYVSAYVDVYHAVARDTSIKWRDQGGSTRASLDMILNIVRLCLIALGDIKE